MKSATVSDLRDHLSAWLRDVEAGERISILRRDSVIAVLAPPGIEDRIDAAESGRLAQMLGEGAVRRGTGRWPSWSNTQLPGPTIPLLEALLADREEGR